MGATVGMVCVSIARYLRLGRREMMGGGLRDDSWVVDQFFLKIGGMRVVSATDGARGKGGEDLPMR